jgi:hypothetical protein
MFMDVLSITHSDGPFNAHCDVPVPSLVPAHTAFQAVNHGSAARRGNMVHRSRPGHTSGGGILQYEYMNRMAETPDFPSQKQKAPRKERLSHRWTVMPAASAAWDHCE